MSPDKEIALIDELDKAANAGDQKKIEELKAELDRLSETEVGRIFDKLFADWNMINEMETKSIKEINERFQLIYKYCIQPDSTKKRIQIALNKSVWMKIYDAAQFLLSNGANVNTPVNNTYPIQSLDIHKISRYISERRITPEDIKREQILILLVYHGAYVDQDQSTESILKSFNELFKIANDLSHYMLPYIDTTIIQIAPDVNGRRKSDGSTALHVSLRKNNTKFAKALLKSTDVRIHLEDHNKITPFQMIKEIACDNSERACVLGLFICKLMQAIEKYIGSLPKGKSPQYSKIDLSRFELCKEYITRFITFYEKEILNLKDKKLHQDIHACADKISDHLTMVESPLYNPELGKKLLDSMLKITSPEETEQYGKINQMLFKYNLDMSIKKEEAAPDPSPMSLESKEETESKTLADKNLEDLLLSLFKSTQSFQVQQPVVPMISQFCLGDALPATQKQLEGVTGCNPESMIQILKTLKHYKEKYEAEKEKRETLEKALQLEKEKTRTPSIQGAP